MNRGPSRNELETPETPSCVDGGERGAGVTEPRGDAVAVDEPWLGRMITADGLFVTDEHQQIVNWSSAAQRMLGYEAEEVLDHPCFLVLMGREPGGHPVCRKHCPVTTNARRGRGTASYEVAARARDGSVKYMSNSVLVVDGPRGKFHVIHLLRELREAPVVGRRTATASSPRAESAPIGSEALTRRELEVVRKYGGGSTLEEVAGDLGISVFTARNHLASAQRKVGARNRLELVLVAMRLGLI